MLPVIANKDNPLRKHYDDESILVEVSLWFEKVDNDGLWNKTVSKHYLGLKESDKMPKRDNKVVEFVLTEVLRDVLDSKCFVLEKLGNHGDFMATTLPIEFKDIDYENYYVRIDKGIYLMHKDHNNPLIMVEHDVPSVNVKFSDGDRSVYMDVICALLETATEYDESRYPTTAY